LAHETFTPRDASEIDGHAPAAKPHPAIGHLYTFFDTQDKKQSEINSLAGYPPFPRKK
jgi:hypothetical protein